MAGRKPNRGRGAVFLAGGENRTERISTKVAYDKQRSLSSHNSQSDDGEQPVVTYGGKGDPDFFDISKENDGVTDISGGGEMEVVAWCDEGDPNENHIITQQEQQHGTIAEPVVAGKNKKIQSDEKEGGNVPNGDANSCDSQEIMDAAGAGEWKNARESKKRKIEQSPPKNKHHCISDSELDVLSPGVVPVNQEIYRMKHFTGVANATIRSDQNGKTIIIKPTGANANSFLKDPVGLAKGFKCSPFTSVKAEMRVNNRRNVVAVELNENNQELINELVKTKKIGKWDVTCYQPGRDVICSGVIGPIGKETNLQELQDLMEAEGGKPIIGVTRLNQFKGGHKQESLSIKVDFAGRVLPNKIIIGMISFSVRAYIPPPLRCYRCQRLGHIAAGCTADFRCLVCAGNHSIRDGCSAYIFKCANCGGQHKASSGKCPFIIKSNEVRGLSITEGISIREAERLNSSKYKEHYRRIENNSSLKHTDRQGDMRRVEVEVEVHQSQGSSIYAEDVGPRSYASVTEGNVRGRRVEKQSNLLSENRPYKQNNELNQGKGNNSTDGKHLDATEIVNMIEKVVDAKMEEFIIRIGKMLKEILMLNLQNEGRIQRGLLLESVIRNNLGKEIDKEILEQMEGQVVEETLQDCNTERQDIIQTTQISKSNSQRTTRAKSNSGGKGTKTKSQESYKGKKSSINDQ